MRDHGDMDFDEFEVYEEWSPLSGYVPLLEAEHRLAAARRALDGLEGWIGSLNLELAAEAKEQLNLIRADPEASVYEPEAREFLEDQMLALRDELPLMQYGVLVVYLFSLLESCLAGCLETVGAIGEAPVPGRINGAKIEGYLAALKATGLRIDLNQETKSELNHWRKIRNAIVHELERPEGVGSRSPGAGTKHNELLSPSGLGALIDLIEEVIAEVDRSMDRI
jgi:hypothetical protein